MHIHTTDFDAHIDALENSVGKVLFYKAKTNPGRFVNTAVQTVQRLEAQQQCVLIFNEKGTPSRKVHRIVQRIGTQLESKHIHTLVHAFIVPPALFNMLEEVYMETP